MEQESFEMRGRIPAAVVMTFFLQVAGALIWATHLEARVAGVEQQSITNVQLNEKFARLDERLEFLRQEMQGLRKQMDVISQKFAE